MYCGEDLRVLVGWIGFAPVVEDNCLIDQQRTDWLFFARR
jgi:hypothetical protein